MAATVVGTGGPLGGAGDSEVRVFRMPESKTIG
jgi:hypothetical protein